MYIYITEKKQYLNKIVVKSNVIMATDAAEVARKWWASRKASRALSIRAVSGGRAVGTWNIKD